MALAFLSVTEEKCDTLLAEKTETDVGEEKKRSVTGALLDADDASFLTMVSALASYLCEQCRGGLRPSRRESQRSRSHLHGDDVLLGPRGGEELPGGVQPELHAGSRNVARDGLDGEVVLGDIEHADVPVGGGGVQGLPRRAVPERVRGCSERR